MDNTYSFGIHANLSPNELLFYIFIDETCKEFGADDVSAAAAVLAGQNWIPTRAKPMGATKGTSVASIMGRRYLNYDLKRKILPTVTNESLKSLRILMTKNIGKFVGRAVPVVGWVVLAYNAASISRRSIANYNHRVKPEDRVF
ncbi:STM2901 family protein [Herbaspirillum seropedicae]|uniref:STM2901 family protein n=1 Tax=Herbaspirillum seropedicae TaxID=964 RepID=UPI003D99EE57